MDHRPFTFRVRTAGAVFSAALLLASSGCGDAGGPEGSEGALTVRMLDVSFLEPGGMPHLSPAGDGVILSWQAPEGEDHVVKAVRYDAGPPGDSGGFGDVSAVVKANDLFVNWADFPSVVEVAPDRWVAHWLQRGGAGTYDYSVRVVTSPDAGATWSEPWTPHEDGTPTEHGFVSVWPDGEGGWHLVWLDGRRYAPGPHGEATDEMTVRSRHVSAAGEPGPELLVDARTCDCCQTDVAVTEAGPVVVYRDRSPGEVRDVYLSRLVDGAWSEPHAVHDDGWVIAACPVNGPTVDARGRELAVAWFTNADEEPRVRVAFSGDAGDTFSPPVRVDDGNPVGRTDVVLQDDGSALVVWLEDVGGGTGEIRLRRVTREGEAGPAHTLMTTTSARAAGFPQFVPLPGGAFLAAWTEPRPDQPSAVRVARVELP